MTGFILTIHFIVCIFMIIVILLQAGKGADMGATFGGGSQTVFGPRGAATFLSKVTTIAAVVFLVTSISLANLSKHRSSSSVVKGVTLPGTPKPESAPLAAESGPSAESTSSTPPAESKPK
ncbi:MAG: preprotein translocase subunit SecG [bacterium]